MKICERCGTEISTKDGENLCTECDGKTKRSARANRLRRERAQVMRDLGLVRVRGSLGGTYWE